MAHSHAEYRSHAVSRKRVGKLLKDGGHAHSDEAADKKLIKKMISQHEKTEHDVPGKKSGGRLDKYARGGRTKSRRHKGGNQVNIAIVAPHGRHHPADAGALPGGPVPVPPPGAGGIPPGLPPGAGGGPPGLPPGVGMGPPGPMPPMKRGGRVKMRGGSETGVGRLDKVKAYGKRARSG